MANVTVADLAAAQADAVKAVHDDALVAAATNGATILVNNGAYTLADSLANLTAADPAVVADAGSYTLSDAVGSLADLSVATAGFVADATNAGSYTYTLNDSLANVVGADSTLVSGHDVTLSDSSIDSTNLVSVLSKTTGLVDASAATNDLTVDFSAFTTNVNFKAGSGADLIKAGTGVDTLSGGAGTDTFAFAAGSNGAVFGQADVITDFVIGTDKLQFTNVTAVESTEQSSVQSAVDALTAGSTAAQIASAMATANTTDFGVSFATFEGNSYVLQEASGIATGVAANDVFIQLTGVATAPTFADVIA